MRSKSCMLPEYIDAFFKNVQWAEVERRLGRAQTADVALRS